MQSSSADTRPGGAPTLTLKRVFKAPRERVFTAWTDSDQLRQWWGPVGFDWVDCTLDLVPGGLFHYGMRAPGGEEMWGKWIFREILPPERLVFINAFADAQGGTIRSPFSEEWPLEVFNELTFTEEEGATLVTLRGWPLDASEAEQAAFDAAHSSLRQGFAATWEQLDAYLREHDRDEAK